ncbi:MAG: hypothetical protein ACLQA5_06815 [Solirubrobacteraceae bacterium]
MLILNIVLMALVVAAIAGLLVWSVLTQHRVPGYEHVRRLRISVKPAPVEPLYVTRQADRPLVPDI